jgi:hypothetical protein
LQVLLCKDNSLVGRVNEQVVSLEKEVAVLKQLDHPNIVRYLVGLPMQLDMLQLVETSVTLQFLQHKVAK